MISLLLAVALQFTEAHAKLAYETARSLVETYTPRDAGSIRGRQAANFILDRASIAGADVRRDSFEACTPAGMRTFTNLYSEFKSDPKGKWVVLVSHFDTKPGVNCPGANDGASTTGLLVALADVLSSRTEHKGNVLLVWTDGEECVSTYSPTDGFWGSRRAVEHIARKGYPIQAVICLDMLGDRDLKISVPANGTETLAKIAVHAARRAGYPGLVERIPEFVKDDHVPFLDQGYKAIDLIDFDYGSSPGANDFWHTEKDALDKISVDSLLKSGRITVELLNILL